MKKRGRGWERGYGGGEGGGKRGRGLAARK